MNKKILLTSAGLTTENLKNAFLDLVKDLKEVKIAILATKYNGSAVNMFSTQIKKSFEDMGFSGVEILDLEENIENRLGIFNVFYICGGNTFEILKFAKQNNLGSEIEKLFERNGVYVGVSAGSIIVGLNINIANEVEPDPNNINLQDLSGLGIVSEIVCPHYIENHEEQVLEFEEKYDLKVFRLTDEQGLLINGKIEII